MLNKYGEFESAISRNILSSEALEPKQRKSRTQTEQKKRSKSSLLLLSVLHVRINDCRVDLDISKTTFLDCDIELKFFEI